MKLFIYDPYKRNTTVTREYVLSIAQAFINNGCQTELVDELTRQRGKNRNAVLVIAAKDAIKAKRLGYGRVYLWVQGIAPEESFMRHNSRLRYLVLCAIEKRGLKCADFVFYVSNAMKEHYRKKYGYCNENCYIMPCFNTEIDESTFFADGKYGRNLFVYAGGLDPWQCFEQTVKLYGEVEKRVSNAELRVLTKERDIAEQMIKKYGIRSYSLDFKSQSEMRAEMEKAKFGFSLREEHPVNYVSTPTKLSTYVSYGVIPIYSKNTADFASVAKGAEFAVRADSDNGYGIEELVALCSRDISPNEVLADFRRCFGNYYSKEYHIGRMTALLEREAAGIVSEK